MFAPGFAEGSLDGAVLTRSASDEALLRADTLQFGGSDALSDIEPKRLPLTPPPAPLEPVPPVPVAQAITPMTQPVALATEKPDDSVGETLRDTQTIPAVPVVRSSGAPNNTSEPETKPVPTVRSSGSASLGKAQTPTEPVPSVKSPAFPEATDVEALDLDGEEAEDDGPSMYEDGSYWKNLVF